MRPSVLALFLLLPGCGHIVNEPPTNRSDRARAFLDSLFAGSEVPGIQYLAVDAERTLFEYDGGLADIRDRREMDATTTMMAYSMSKTITAAAVLQLVEANQIHLDSSIALYLDSLLYPPTFTVRQLLAHTSGVPNPIPLRWVHPAARHATFDEAAALASVLQAHPRLASDPGTEYAYSNIGYWLLGRIVERVSGESFASYVGTHVLRPLGATPQELGYTIPHPAHHATGYLAKYSFLNLVKGVLIDRELVGEYAGRWLAIRSHYVNGAAFGGLVGTARGFGKFLQDQLRPHSRLFNDSTRTLFYAAQHTGDGTPIAMTLGWHIGRLGGEEYYFKEGGGGGFHCMMRIYPARGVATVVMSNSTGFDVKRVLNRLDAEFLR